MRILVKLFQESLLFIMCAILSIPSLVFAQNDGYGNMHGGWSMMHYGYGGLMMWILFIVGIILIIFLIAQLSKGKRTVAIHYSLKIDSSDALQGAYQEGILAQEIARVRALHPSFTEAGIGFLQELDLFFRKLYILTVLYLLKAQEAFVAGF